MLVDTYGRQITYLRVSVTDRCNFRCVYCMPPEGVPLQPHHAIMRYEEIAEVVRVAAELGVKEVRLTGGEPLVRPDLAELIQMIHLIPGIEDISLTTNALLLDKMAASFAEAGLNRINVSLDTLDPVKFDRITRGGSFERTWQGIETAERCGLKPIKINMVVMRGVNDDELVEMAKLTLDRDWHVRFIELMPVKNQETWGNDFPSPQEMYFSVQEMLEIFEPMGIQAVSRSVGQGPARVYRLPGAKGQIGFISPLGDHFCGDCNRLRLTADGNLRPCLLSDVEIPLVSTLRSGESILPVLQKAVSAKPLGHELSLQRVPTGRCMRQIGG